MRSISLLALLGLAACTAADVQPSAPLVPSEESPLWSIAESADDLRARSCPDGVGFQRAEAIELSIIEAERGPEAAQDLNLQGLTLAGAWHLKSDEPTFGGLSGLDVLRSGSLLAITDSGKFAWIGIDPETGIPDGFASMADMKNADGEPWPGKLAADSEGLSFKDGLAFVSFEREFRVEAYDLEGCGADARAARVLSADKVIDGEVLGDNRGPEGLSLSDDGLKLGFEEWRDGGSPILRVRSDGALSDLKRTTQPALYLLTGMDDANGLNARVFRAYDPIRGARGIVEVHNEDGLIAKANLKSPLPVDNYEGIAIGMSPSGAPRIWLISDDNFSNNQRTLLLAMDLDDAS